MPEEQRVPIPTTQRNLLVRVVEWSAWMPQGKDANNPDMVLSKGETSLPTIPGERLVDIEIMNTGIKGEFDLDSSGERDMKQVCCYYVFQATFAGLAPDGQDPSGFVSPQPSEEDSQAAIEKHKRQVIAESMIVEGNAAGMPRDHRGKGGTRRPKR